LIRGVPAAVYSHRSAIIGSTFVARRAGIQHASNATITSSSGAAANVNGSVAFTPKSKLFINRVKCGMLDSEIEQEGRKKKDHGSLR